MKKYLASFSIVIALVALLFACGSPTRSVPEIPSNGMAEAYISSDRSVFDDFKESYEPPTQQEIFTEWSVFIDNRFWSSRAAIETEVAGVSFSDTSGDFKLPFHPADVMESLWQMDGPTDNQYIIFGQNINDFTGYVSPEKSRRYSLEATLRSWSGDNDSIGLIAAFSRDENANGGKGENYFLAVERSVPTNDVADRHIVIDDWGISVYKGGLLQDPYGINSGVFGVSPVVEDVLYRYQLPALEDTAPGSAIMSVGRGWGDGGAFGVNSATGNKTGDLTSGTMSRSARIRIERDGNKFVFKTTNISPDKRAETHTLAELGGWNEDYTITVDLDAGTVTSVAAGNNRLNNTGDPDTDDVSDDISALNIFKVDDADAGHNYGYFTKSQQDSMWHDIEREVLVGDSIIKDVAFYIDPDTLEAEIYVYEENGGWRHDTEASIETYFNVPVIVENPNDRTQSFVIDKNGNVEIYILPDA